MIKNLSSILGALAILAALYFSGVLASYNITHPVWQKNAVIFGGAGGALLAFLVLLVTAKKPKLSNLITSGVNIVFAVSLVSALYFSYRFINASDFDGFSAQIWHKTSYATIVWFIPQITHLLKKMVFRN